MSQGYFLLGIGRKYIDECSLLVNTLRKQKDQRPISILVNPEDEKYTADLDTYDKIILFNPINHTIWNNCNTNFEKFCLYPRLYLNEYMPYNETVIIDSDVLCQYNTATLWKHLSESQRDIQMTGFKNDPEWHWGFISEVSKAFGKHVPHVHGGFFFIRKSDFVNDFFEFCRTVFFDYEKYNCKKLYQGGKVDEIIFAIAHSHFNMHPIEFTEFPIITFNYTPDINLPSKLQTANGRNVVMSDYIPFVHMFDFKGDKFKLMHDKILSIM